MADKWLLVNRIYLFELISDRLIHGFREVLLRHAEVISLSKEFLSLTQLHLVIVASLGTLPLILKVLLPLN